MSERRNLATVKFCLIFSLAVALAAIGLAILADFATREASSNGRILLPPGGGLASLLVSASFLTLLFRRNRVATLVASVTLLATLGQAALPYMPVAESLKAFSLSPPLALVILLTVLTLIAAIHLKKGRFIGLATSPFVVATGLFSIASYWFPSLQGTSLGTIPESTIIVSPLVILIGLSLPVFHTLRNRDMPDLSPALIVVGVSAIALTIGIWHTMRIQNSNNLQNSAGVLADQLVASGTSIFSSDLALLRRLAQRQQLLAGLPDSRIWTQEVQSYLNDFPHIGLIGILDPQREPTGIHSREDQHLTWLIRFLESPDNNGWLDHVGNTGETHLSPPWPDERGQNFALIASPIHATAGQPWHVVAIIDLEDIFNDLLQHYDGGLSARIYYGDTVIYGFSPYDNHSATKESAISKRGERIPLVTRQMDAHHNSQWRIEVYTRQGGLPKSAFFLPPLVLFTGLTLSFLVMLSHLFWRESERRARSLQQLNSAVKANLHREQSLRLTNERIMEFSRDILCSIDAWGIFTSINPAAEDILGYRPDQLIGDRYDVLIPPEDREATAEEMRKLITGERRISDGFRNRLRHRDSHSVTISWTAAWSEEDQALFCVGRDMSDQLAAETLMREREQFFSLSPDMFCIVDLNSHFFEVNKAFEVVLGYERGELVGTSYLQLICSEDQARVAAAVESMIAGNTISDLQIRVISKDNTEHWLEISAILSSDDLIYVAARDTTEIRQTQEKLRESERLLNIAGRAARIGGWVMDLITGEVRWSHAMFEIHEMAVLEVPTLENALEYYTPGSRETVTESIETCIQAGIPFDEELQIRTQSGQLRWVRAIGQAVKNDEGQIVQIQGALQDITASHQAMEQIQRFAERQSRIFESITDAFYTVDRDWRFTYVNRRSEELLQKSRHDLLGANAWDMFPDAVGSEIEQQYRYAMETGESVSFDAPYEPLDEWFEVSAYPSEEGLAVYYRSIKERKLAEKQLEQTMAELERSNRELQDFAFVASHDLQEPLRKIQTFSDRLLTRPGGFDEQEQDYLRRMQSAAKRMQSLIQDLLTYSRVTSRAQPLSVCDTNHILAEVLQDMETMISRENADIDTRPLPPVTGDATQLRQVFQNLLSNAIKFHKENENPQVSIRAENQTDHGWTLVFSDKGVGFDEHYADKLFQPFQRLHKENFPGTGIGMAIVKKILDRHGATVSVRSAIDQGTSFRIFFPTGNHPRIDNND